MLLLLSSLVSAHAHEPGLSRVTVDGSTLSLQVARVDTSDPMALLRGTTASRGGEPCALQQTGARPDDNGFIVTAELDCPGSVLVGSPLRSGQAEVTVQAGWFSQLAPGHRTVVERDGVPSGFLDAGHAEFEIGVQAQPEAASQVAVEYVGLGIEHILTGWDHLVFLMGLLVVARGLRDIAGVVTGFTLAHSITLSLAALGYVAVPSSVVEPLIALSIVWVGLENLLDPPARRRFVLTLLLGLVHGLGFAGLLADIGFPEGHLPLALAMFNVGVEIGQFGVVLLALPVLQGLRQLQGWRRYGMHAASLAVAAAGLFWFVTRVWDQFVS